MKKTIFQRVLSILGLSVLTVLFFACPNAPQILEQQKVKVTFTVADNAERTVLPQVSGISYKLLGGRNGAAETVLVESFTGTGTLVALNPGTWNFTLNAYNDSGENILQGKVQNKQINLTGANQVSFSLSVINSGMGSIQITLNFPEVAGITRISTSGDVGSENFIPDTGGNFVYAKNEIAAGDYFISFELYRGDVLRTVISELVLVRNGLTSSKTITLVGDDLKPIYLTGTVIINPTVSATIGTELTAIYSGTETVTYQWNKDGSTISGATGTEYTPSTTGSYTVTVSAVGYNISLTSAAVAVIGPDTTVPGSTLQAKLVWLANTAESYSSYILEVSGDETIPSFTLSYSGKSNIVITLKSTGSLRTISLSNNGAMFTVENGVILILDNNITLQGRSGNNNSLVKVNSGGIFSMNGGTIFGNSFTTSSSSSSIYSGGGVYISGGTFIMNGGEISGNNASSSVSRPSSTSYPRAYSGGGVLMLEGTFKMSGGKISNNTASSSSYNDGGTIYSCSGGGVCVISGTFTMSGGEISNNTASDTTYQSTSFGGGVYGTLTMSDGIISNNTGGGVRGTLTMSGGIISGNNGTGVHGTLTMSGGTISNNNATGVYGTLTMSGGTISNNNGTGVESVYTSTMSSGTISCNKGRGVSVGDTFTMSGGTISGNEGGGVSVYGVGYSTFTMNGGEISNNTATNGAGVYVNGGLYEHTAGTFIMNSGNISNNIASQSGGGMYVDIFIYQGSNRYGGTFTMNGGEISGNTASSGGGVYVNNYKTITMNGGTISANTATNGGGVYISTGTFTMSFGEISGNTATNGGGMYLGGGTLIMNSGDISGNTTTNGGGVYVRFGTFTMNGGEISTNISSQSGGGIYVFSNSSFTKTGGTIFGYISGNNNSNTVKDSYGIVLSNKGHAVWVDYTLITIHKETTAEPNVNLSWNGTSNPPTFSGGWEY